MMILALFAFFAIGIDAQKHGFPGILPRHATHPCSANDTEATASVTVTRGSVELTVEFFADCNEKWDRARWICKRKGVGWKMWEPRNRSEYEAVFAALGYDAWNREPDWLFNPRRGFHWWIGLINRNRDGNGAYYASNGRKRAWRRLSEYDQGESCVDIFYEKDYWGDHNCNTKLPYICERRRPHNNLSYG